MNIITALQTYLSYSFVRYALIAGVLISLCAALLGVSLVLKRYSMIGDGLSHVAFGAMSIAAVLSLAPMTVAMPVTIVAAVVLLGLNSNGKIKGDAAIAMIGYLLLNVFQTASNVSGDVCSTLFGSTSILTLSVSDVWLCVGLAILVILTFVIFYHKIFAVTFDEEFARATGTNVRAYNILIAVVTAVVIVLAMNLVGALLISALIIFPALSAMRVFKSFRAVMASAAVISVLCSVLGILASVIYGTPVGSTIVAADIVVFAAFSLAGRLRKAK